MGAALGLPSLSFSVNKLLSKMFPAPMEFSAEQMQKVAPDGYTFLIGSAGTHAHSQSIYKNQKSLYNAAPDLAAITLSCLAAAGPEYAQGFACQQQTTSVHFPCEGELSEHSIRLGCRQALRRSPVGENILRSRSKYPNRAASSIKPLSGSDSYRSNVSTRPQGSGFNHRNRAFLAVLHMRWKDRESMIGRCYHRVHHVLITRSPVRIVIEGMLSRVDGGFAGRNHRNSASTRLYHAPLSCSSSHRRRCGQTPPLGQLQEVVVPELVRV